MRRIVAGLRFVAAPAVVGVLGTAACAAGGLTLFSKTFTSPLDGLENAAFTPLHRMDMEVADITVKEEHGTEITVQAARAAGDEPVPSQDIK